MAFYIHEAAQINLPEHMVVTRSDGKTIEFYSDDVEKFTRDAALDKKPSLSVKINATHSGTIVNRRLYPARYMQAGLDSWVHPYPKTVLSDHPSYSFFGSDSQPVTYGRVKSAEFRRLVPEQELDNDWKTPKVGDTGSGFIRLTTDISHPDAIEGVLSKRLFTVSTGQYTDYMTCSICGSKGCREHLAGDYYAPEDEYGDLLGSNQHLCYNITGPLTYDHVAFVNTPGSPYAAVISTDSQEKEPVAIDNAEFLNFGVNELVLTDGSMEYKFALSDAKPRPKNRVISAVINSIAEDVPAPMPKTKRPGLEAGVVMATVAAADRKDTDKKEKRLMDTKMIAEAVLLSSLVNADVEFDWEAYKEKTGNDRSLCKLSADSAVPETLRPLVDGETEGISYCGPNNSLPVVDENTAEVARKLLQFVQVDNKSVFDAKIEAALNPNINDSDSDDNTPVVDDSRIKELEAELSDRDKRIEDLEKTNSILRATVRGMYVDQVIDLRVQLGKPSVKGASEDELEAVKASLKSRTLESLEDTLKDLRAELSDDLPARPEDKEEIPDPAEVAVKDVAKKPQPKRSEDLDTILKNL